MTILFEKNQNGVANITLNRPEVHNAFDEKMIADLTKAFNELEQSEDIHVVVLSGGGKSFSAGADLDWMKRAANYSFDENLTDANLLSDMLNALYNLRQLTIANVHGAVMGGGLGLISCVDVVIAEPETKFALSEVKLGLIPATIAPFVIESIGARQAKRYFQTGEFFDAKEAQNIGLVHEITSPGDNKLDDLLKNILKNAPDAVKDAKKLVLDFAGERITVGLRNDSAGRIAKTRASKEAKEGLSAFFEKRKANWIKDV